MARFFVCFFRIPRQDIEAVHGEAVALGRAKENLYVLIFDERQRIFFPQIFGAVGKSARGAIAASGAKEEGKGLRWCSHRA